MQHGRARWGAEGVRITGQSKKAAYNSIASGNARAHWCPTVDADAGALGMNPWRQAA
eukprot:CAMPEP_0195022758 /NCGR_PEP_ID=MMETSP0326_2-20130528/41287_1 /TAXON_ID=2866 ORGANISM="Crypthecodinium cohnii, Strain Seligo" /NCGR_SAMPLE_ID=MMETSP0326_2 /ASSEMBLY_ACC=CAM_ASM_000348 /LENGTH=56 /DNA_ID=CAMNT_0040042703 /DNA_START=85 /DNA_END=251 /DNA_ORIENTATION=+